MKLAIPPAIRNVLDAARTVGVAVSGGADSISLFHLLKGWYPELVILHVNHQLRGAESDADEEFVRAVAARTGTAIRVLRCDTRAVGGNVEEDARRIRYEFYRSQIAEGAVDCVATGHTRGDQAETVLFRLLRGAHLSGLAGVLPIAPGPIVRPLLGCTRGEIEEYLRLMGEPWREDSSNRSLDFDRNRIRHELLPQLTRDWNPELERSLAHMATLASDEEIFWQVYIHRLAEEMFETRGNIVLVAASKLAGGQPVAVARRLVRRAIELVRGNLHSVGFAHVEQILDLARQNEGHGRLQIPGVDVMRSFDWLRFGDLPEGDRLAARNVEAECVWPGEMELPGTSVCVSLEVIELSSIDASGGSLAESARVMVGDLDLDRVEQLGASLRLRTWRPGDQYSPPGEPAGRKLKTMFQDSRVPLWDRGTWPMITAGQQILWAKLFGPAAAVAAGPESKRLLRVHVKSR